MQFTNSKDQLPRSHVQRSELLLRMPEFEARFGRPGLIRDESLAIGREFGVGGHFAKGQVGDFAPRGDVPEFDRAVPAQGCDRFIVRRERDAGNAFFVTVEYGDDLECVGPPKNHPIVHRSGGNQRTSLEKAADQASSVCFFKLRKFFNPRA